MYTERIEKEKQKQKTSKQKMRIQKRQSLVEYVGDNLNNRFVYCRKSIKFEKHYGDRACLLLGTVSLNRNAYDW